MRIVRYLPGAAILASFFLGPIAFVYVLANTDTEEWLRPEAKWQEIGFHPIVSDVTQDTSGHKTMVFQLLETETSYKGVSAQRIALVLCDQPLIENGEVFILSFAHTGGGVWHSGTYVTACADRQG